MLRHMPGDADVIVPVPLHRWRVWSRGYNQAGLIAAALSRITGVVTEMRILKRRHATPVLRGLGVVGRRQAVRGAFALAHDARGHIAGKRIVLVDDVHTSGATVDACTATLLGGGAMRVSVLCWARVLDEAITD